MITELRKRTVGSVRYHPSWPGLSVNEGHLLHSASGLAAAERALSDQVAAFNRAANAGSLPDLHRATRIFTPPEAPGVHYGEWYTARHLGSAHFSASAHALAVYSGVLHNVEQAAVRLLAISENYRRAELNIEEAINRRGRTGAVAIPYLTSLSPRPPGSTIGALEVTRARPYPEDSAEYDPDLIAQWLRPLQNTKAWHAHYEMSGRWRAAADAAQILCDALFRRAWEIHDSWQDRAAVIAQHKLRRIEGTAQSLTDFMWTLTPLSRYSAEALEQTLGAVRLGSPMTWNPSGRRTRIRAAFDQLNSRYREIIDAYPRSLSFDLPFGGIAQPDEDPPPDGPPLSPEPDSPIQPAAFHAQPVIGAELPPSMTFDIDQSHWLTDIGPHGPGTIEDGR
jgi:hypothetical protein